MSGLTLNAGVEDVAKKYLASMQALAVSLQTHQNLSYIHTYISTPTRSLKT